MICHLFNIFYNNFYQDILIMLRTKSIFCKYDLHSSIGAERTSLTQSCCVIIGIEMVVLYHRLFIDCFFGG